jgi:hypothetical protein
MLYTCVGTQTAAAKTALGVVATAAVRPRLVGFTLSNIGVVATDSGFQIQVKRFTAAGTSTAITPAPADSGDPASTFTAGSNHSAEPTYTANTTFKDVSVNPRGTARWQAYEQRGELVAPATAANGFGFFVNALGGAVTVNADAEVMQ